MTPLFSPTKELNVLRQAADFSFSLSKKVLIRQYLVETDIHPLVSGVTFDQVRKNRVSGTYGNGRIFYSSLDGLITTKQAAGRPKDLKDLRILQILRDALTR